MEKEREENFDKRIAAMEQWASNIADRWLDKADCTPDSVLARAALKTLARLSARNRSLLPKPIIRQLLEVELQELPDAIGKA